MTESKEPTIEEVIRENQYLKFKINKYKDIFVKIDKWVDGRLKIDMTKFGEDCNSGCGTAFDEGYMLGVKESGKAIKAVLKYNLSEE